jgi:hypothetical protein
MILFGLKKRISEELVIGTKTPGKRKQNRSFLAPRETKRCTTKNML